jgi:hypothetical protein
MNDRVTIKNYAFLPDKQIPLQWCQHMCILTRHLGPEINTYISIYSKHDVWFSYNIYHLIHTINFTLKIGLIFFLI